MKHGKKLKKLNRDSSHRKSLLMNLAISLFKHERIQTTVTKAKALRPFAEKLITKAKNKNLHTIRQLASNISDKSIVKKLVEELGERFKTRAGGYTRIYKFGFRTNDGAPLALIELVDYSIKNAAQKGKAENKTKFPSITTTLKSSNSTTSQKIDSKPASKNDTKTIDIVKESPAAKTDTAKTSPKKTSN